MFIISTAENNLRGLLASTILSACRPIFLLSVYRPLFVGNMYSGYVSHCFLIKSTAGSLRPIYDDEGDEMLSPSLGLYYLLAGLCRILGEMYAVLLFWVYTTSFQTLLDVSTTWVSTTSFQTLLDIGGNVCRLLVWAFTTCSRGLLQETEGDICCSPCLGLGLYYLLSGLRRMLGEMYAVLLVWVWEMCAVLLVWV